MEEHVVKIRSINQVTHDVKSFRLERPSGYTFHPGQATELSINLPEWKEEKRPFTFTSLEEDAWLEFTIKRYEDHHGVTNKLHQLSVGDELILRDVWGTIEYNGPGYFIAGGAGITPFIAILRRLHHDKKIAGNSLYFSNKTVKDIIYEKEFAGMLGKEAHFILSNEPASGYTYGRIDEAYLRQQKLDISKHFYVCGPDPMVKGLTETLSKLGAKTELVVFEK